MPCPHYDIKIVQPGFPQLPRRSIKCCGLRIRAGRFPAEVSPYGRCPVSRSRTSETEQKPEEQNLAEVLSAYMTLRHDGRSDWSRAGQTKAQVNDTPAHLFQLVKTGLHRFKLGGQVCAGFLQCDLLRPERFHIKRESDLVLFQAIIFLQSHDITTVQKLGAHLDEARATANGLRNQIRSNDRCTSTVGGYDLPVQVAEVGLYASAFHSGGRRAEEDLRGSCGNTARRSLSPRA